MPTFDIVSKIDAQEVDNAFNQAKKEMDTRYDFRGISWEADYNKADKKITFVSESDFSLKAMGDILKDKLIKRKLDLKGFDFSEPKESAGSKMRQEVSIKDGIDKETAKKITKRIKDSKIKVSAQIMDDQVRVTGKKRDDLQNVIADFKEKPMDIPLQYINFRDK